MGKQGSDHDKLDQYLQGKPHVLIMERKLFVYAAPSILYYIKC